jgi:hypothetical protein
MIGLILRLEPVGKPIVDQRAARGGAAKWPPPCPAGKAEEGGALFVRRPTAFGRQSGCAMRGTPRTPGRQRGCGASRAGEGFANRL